MFRFPFIPKEREFFDLFEKSTQNMLEAARELNKMVCTWENINESVDRINDLEHEGDTITHTIMAQLHRTFVTPFDRQDMAQLSLTLDDVTDFIYAAASGMLRYKLDRSSQRAKELTDIIVEASAEVQKAILLLRHRADLKKVLKCCVEINRLENVADGVFHSAQAELFDDTTDMAQVIKWREIYEYMESATDRCEDVSNVLEGVALKYA